jgi:hypothetical protein
VLVRPAAGGGTVNAKDTNGDGVLWTVQTIPVVCGTIDYFTGALVLNFPVGHAPAAGVIRADYSSQDETTKALGKRSVQIGNLPPSETLIVYAAAKEGTSPVHLDAVISF